MYYSQCKVIFFFKAKSSNHFYQLTVRFLLNQNGLDSTHYIKQTLPLTKALLIASINLSSSMEIRFFACSGVVDHTNELKFSVNLTWIKIKNPVNYIVSRDSNHTVKQTIVGFGCCVLYS